jgi:sterol desaturase/sphingolipid hydroxylase (fatty acid hydroxylase superfamily)
MHVVGPALDLASAHVGDLWQLTLRTLMSLPVLIAAFYVVERVRPVDPRDVGLHANVTDLCYYLFGPAMQGLSRACAVLGMLAFAAAAGLAVEPGLRQGFGPVMKQPDGLILLEMLVLVDFIAYWSHRLCHSVPFLWRFHAIHHSSKKIHWLSAARSHPLNDAFTHVLNVMPLVMLGFPVDALMKLFPLVALSAFFIQSNLNLTLRPIAYVVTSPVYHRFHHTSDQEGGHKNFAGLFPIFDKLFGTYYLPREPPVSFELEDDMPYDFLGQLCHPFRRRVRGRQDEQVSIGMLVNAHVNAKPPS